MDMDDSRPLPFVSPAHSDAALNGSSANLIRDHVTLSPDHVTPDEADLVTSSVTIVVNTHSNSHGLQPMNNGIDYHDKEELEEATL